VKFIHGASVPVVKATCTPAYGSKKLDITIQDGKHSGPKCVQLVADYLLSFECLRYLVLPFKQLIYNSQMNDPYQGGLTSYALVLMIVAFLQMKVYNKMPTEVKSPNLGILFIEFLSYYSNLDYMATEIKPLAPEKEIITPPFSATQGDSTPNSILVVDPLNPLNNVARSTYKFHFLKVARGNLGRIYFLSHSSRLFL
jgi:non-canonical poly(A) RNA polymerase PAPD5/7